MVKIAFVADVHLGNHRRQGGGVVTSLNKRCVETLGVLRNAVEYAREEQCDGFVVLGDLFDSTTPLPQLIAATADVLEGAHPMRVDLLAGNHEQVSTAKGDHALAPLSARRYSAHGRSRVLVAESPIVIPYGDGVKLLLVPYWPGPAAEWLPGVLETHCEPFDGVWLLGVHMGIQDNETAHYLKGAHDSIEHGALRDLCAKHNIRAAFAGNWHDHRVWRGTGGEGPDVIQCGALVPTGWDNPGLDGYGTVVIWEKSPNVSGIECTHLPGPRFVKESTDALAMAKRVTAEEYGCTVYVDTTPDRKVSMEAARDAALAARSADTLKEALGNFVERMPLDDGVDRREVLRRCGSYLK